MLPDPFLNNLSHVSFHFYEFFTSLASFYTYWEHNTLGFLMFSGGIPLATGRKLKVYKTFRKHIGRLLNDLCTLNLRPLSRRIERVEGRELKKPDHKYFRWIWRTCAYHVVRNVSFSENFAHALNGWSL